MHAAAKGDCMQHTCWCRSIVREEFARIYSWDNDPARQGDYDAASPCKHVDLPQTVLEPVPVRHATLNGIHVRFDTKLISCEREASGTTVSLVEDIITKETQDKI